MPARLLIMRLRDRAWRRLSGVSAWASTTGDARVRIRESAKTSVMILSMVSVGRGEHVLKSTDGRGVLSSSG
jgi:hypothetical protein